LPESKFLENGFFSSDFQIATLRFGKVATSAAALCGLGRQQVLHFYHRSDITAFAHLFFHKVKEVKRLKK